MMQVLTFRVTLTLRDAIPFSTLSVLWYRENPIKIFGYYSLYIQISLRMNSQYFFLKMCVCAQTRAYIYVYTCHGTRGGYGTTLWNLFSPREQNKHLYSPYQLTGPKFFKAGFVCLQPVIQKAQLQFSQGHQGHNDWEFSSFLLVFIAVAILCMLSTE